MNDGAIRMVVVSDRVLSRTALVGVLSANPNCVITGQSDSLEDALSLCSVQPVDAVVVDAEIISQGNTGTGTLVADLAMPYLAPEESSAIADLFPQDGILPPWRIATADVSSLSDRERQVFLLLGFGLSNRQIGRRLNVTERTVKAHVGRVMAKLGLKSRLQSGLAALMYLTERGRHPHDGDEIRHPHGRGAMGPEQGDRARPRARGPGLRFAENG